ncbi:MAG: BrnT family toxin [Bryobacteraceae bacterium]|nr:BrnT family toxin [Bryobacteraceae bacterium]
MKHGVHFADAVAVLEDPRALSMRDDRHDEERWVTIGMDPLARLLVVVHTWSIRGEGVVSVSSPPEWRPLGRSASTRKDYEERIRFQWRAAGGGVGGSGGEDAGDDPA